MTRVAAVLVAVVGLLVLGSLAAPATASASSDPSADMAHLATRPAADERGIDPAAIRARENRIGYNEQRKFPYGMVVFLIALTAFCIPLIISYREPPRRDVA